MRFRRYVAIDWSGARDRGRGLPGIQVAACGNGRSAPAIVSNPRGGAWRRSDIVAWLSAAAGGDGPVLVGFDFAFAFPYCDDGSYLPGVRLDEETPAALWRLVETLSGDAAELYGGGFARDPRFAGAFWRHGPRPSDFDERHRRTEVSCRRQGGGAPETVFKLVGAKQVGLGSMAGMRVLARLRRQAAVSIWPFDRPDTRCVCVEIFPRHFLLRAGLGRRKAWTREDLDTALRAYDCEPTVIREGDLGGDRTDALISAAALRRVATEDEAWRPPSMTACARDREGWIFGVA
jgi:hypothetical protein